MRIRAMLVHPTPRRRDRPPVLSEALSPGGPPPCRGGSIGMRAPLGLRLSVYVTRGRLDRQLAAGRPPASSAALALRARQLNDPRTRRRIARGLRGVVEFVVAVDRRCRPAVPAFSAVVILPAPVRAGSAGLLGLADRLDGPDPVNARGVALAKALLTEGTGSPLFNPNCERTVAEAVWEIADALGADDPPAIGSYSFAGA
jgi:hypothetical protein